MRELIERLRGLIADATPGDLETAERHIKRETIECPFCGDGEIEAADYCNFDAVALGVQFYGIGKHFGAHEALWRETVKSLPAMLGALEAQEARIAQLEGEKAKLSEAAMAAKKHLRSDLDEPGRTVFWKLVDALRNTEAQDG